MLGICPLLALHDWSPLQVGLLAALRGFDVLAVEADAIRRQKILQVRASAAAHQYPRARVRKTRVIKDDRALVGYPLDSTVLVGGAADSAAGSTIIMDSAADSAVYTAK